MEEISFESPANRFQKSPTIQNKRLMLSETCKKHTEYPKNRTTFGKTKFSNVDEVCSSGFLVSNLYDS